MAAPKSPKDKIKIKFNPIEGKFDLVQEFNPDRIITHSFNPAGNPLVLYDPITGQYLPMDDQIVTDLNGNVVTI